MSIVNCVCCRLETLSEALIIVYVLFMNVYVIVVYKMIESCTKRRMIVAITLLGGQVINLVYFGREHCSVRVT